MTRALGIIAGAALILLYATLLLIVMPTVQIRAGSSTPPDGLTPYTEAELRGRDQYVSLGCVYCHSQQPRDPGQAPDDKRGWGRASVPADYVFDDPHLLGTMRTGPDLFNIGARQPSADWHLTHLYQPRAVVPGSTMPAYPFLFEVIDVVVEGNRVVKLPADIQPETGTVVAKPAALDLVKYLQALDHTYPVEEIPVVESTPDEGQTSSAQQTGASDE